MFQRLRNPFAKPKPIIVVSGLPRSGTSMMMQMLAAGGMAILSDHLREPDVNNPNGYYECERVKKLRDGDVQWLADAQGHAVKIVSGLLQHLPDDYDYRIIFMQRRMTEILRSQRKMLADRGEPTDRYSLVELDEQYQTHLDMVMNWLDQHTNMQVLYINHHDVLRDPTTQAARIALFLQQRLDTQAMAAAVDAKLYRNKST